MSKMSKKDDYLAIAKVKLDEQMAKLELLKEKAKDEIAEQKDKNHELIEDLERKIAAAKTHFGKLSNSAEDTWENVRDKFDELSDNIGGSLKKLFGGEKDKKGNDTPPKKAGKH